MTGELDPARSLGANSVCGCGQLAVWLSRALEDAGGERLSQRNLERSSPVRSARSGTTVASASTEWIVGITLGVVVIAVAAAILITIVALAARIAAQAKAAEDAVEVVRAQTDALDGIGRINDSGVRSLHSARALRKVAVGK